MLHPSTRLLTWRSFFCLCPRKGDLYVVREGVFPLELSTNSVRTISFYFASFLQFQQGIFVVSADVASSVIVGLEYLTHRHGFASELGQKHLLQIVQRPRELEEKRLSTVGRVVFEGRHTLLDGRTFLGHDFLHDLVAKGVLADEDQMMAGTSALAVFESKRKNVLATHFDQSFANLFNDGLEIALLRRGGSDVNDPSPNTGFGAFSEVRWRAN